MTGTPVENRLEELWSIFHVVNPSVLGTRARFRQRFARPIETGRSGTAAARRATVIEPFVLRRTKTKVATDLPDKQYATIACTLTAEQARLYRAAVADAFTTGLGSGIARHVVRFDRWWNPAVEDQATDRAHRIGQRQRVNVHTLVTGGTIGDHIAAMHESKRAVADAIARTPDAAGPEAALAAMPDAQLRELLELDLIGAP